MTEMDSIIFDEIFEKLNFLESENQILKNELEKLNEEENKSEIENLINFNISQEKFDKINDINKKLTSIKKEDSGKFYELIINFKPYDEVNSMEISGDFTNWKKISMEKVYFFNR